MSWPLAAVLILLAGLAAGFAWYERTQPDAKLVALVGTLAALGALGRIAFAAIPNVKPTTDIVLVAGYALGGAPGYVVGALSALVSNLFFGQGPWTPWQMLGWGATGLAGAGLAIVTRRRIGRWPLAIVCTVVGFAFTALQDVGDWVTYSDHSLGSLGVYVGKGLGFDAIHAAGCAVFAIAFGPALIASLQRFRRRLAVSWAADAPGSAPAHDYPYVFPSISGKRRDSGAGGAPDASRSGMTTRAGASAVILAGVLGVAGALAPAGPRRADAAGSPAGYLESAQNPDGGVGAAPGQPSSPLFAGWAAIGLEADGIDPADVVRDGHSLASYVEADQDHDPGSLERTILALAPIDGSAAVRASVTTDLGALTRDISRDGSVQDQSNLTAFAILAERAAGATVPARTVAWLAAQQDGDGGFNFATRGGASDADDTGAVLEALAPLLGSAAAPGVHGIDGTVVRAVRFLEHDEQRGGGFPAQAGGDPNAQSTAFAVQGLIAAGPASARSVTQGRAYLRALTTGSGAVDYASGQSQTPVWVTGEALAALAARALPLPRVSPPASGRTSRPGSPARTGNRPSRRGIAGRREPVRPAHLRRRRRPGPGHAGAAGVASGPPPARLVRIVERHGPEIVGIAEGLLMLPVDEGVGPG